ncbi:MAG: hypothetical protein WCL00_01615 [Bacteroidota bacterium]
MSEFETWVYRGIIALLLIVLWAVIKIGATKILEELKAMNTSLRVLSDSSLIHDQNIKTVNDRIGTHEVRLNDHGERIREVERKQDSCNYCKES